MALYRIIFKPAFPKDIKAIPKNQRARIIQRIESLATNPKPHGCEKLAGQEKYRIRQGDYRILYTVNDYELAVRIIKVGNRKDIYRVSEEKTEYLADKSVRSKTGKTKRLP